MRRISEFEPIYVDCWAWQQAFRKLGFPSDNIYVVFGRNGEIPGGPDWIFVVLKAQRLEFTVPVGARTMADDVFAKKWTEFCDAFNAWQIDEADLVTAYGERMGTKHSQLIEKMLRKGFRLPGNISN